MKQKKKNKTFFLLKSPLKLDNAFVLNVRKKKFYTSVEDITKRTFNGVERKG